MISKIHSVVPYGFEGKLVEVEGDMNKGLPAFNIVGMANKTVSEAKERVRSAIVNSEFSFPDKKVTINLAPADLLKDGAYLDVPIALAILMLSGQIIKSDTTNSAFVGELSLDGEIRPVKGIINIVEAAKTAGYKSIYVPLKNLPQTRMLSGIDIYGAGSLQDLYLALKRQIELPDANTAKCVAKKDNKNGEVMLDHIRGQEVAKRAMTIAIAGHHNILISGPPGAGKTLLAKAVASESDAHFILINGPEIMSKYVGGSEENLREYFEEAEANSPSIIFIDELDAIAPKREDTNGETERRTVAQLLTLMDGLKSRGQVVVIGATNRPDSLDAALRRPGRFDREIEIGVPDADERQQILEIHTRNMPIADDIDLNRLATTTHGFVGADLESLCKEAAMRVVRRILPEIKNDDEEIPEEVLKKIIVTKDDFKSALKEIQPSALREVLVQVPDIEWDDVGGLDDAKQELKEAVEWPLKYPENFQKLGVKPPKGILLYGIPGTGKTLLAKAVASESEANFISVKGPELLSKWVGESEKGVREVFRKAKQTAPTVIFFDEIDSIASTRSGDDGDSGVTKRVVNQLLTEMDGLEELEDVAIIAATNRPDIIDPGLMRPGRFDRHIKVDTPSEEARLAIFEVHTKDMPLANDVDLKKLAKMTDGYVGADIEAVCREAAMLTLRNDMESSEIENKYFKEAIEKVKPGNNSDEQLVQYM